MSNLRDIQPGDEVVRWLCGTIPQDLKVTEVTEDKIICGPWEFDRTFGAEIDDDIGSGPPPKYQFTASLLKKKGEPGPMEKQQ
jgi:hypothetical protein